MALNPLFLVVVFGAIGFAVWCAWFTTRGRVARIDEATARDAIATDLQIARPRDIILDLAGRCAVAPLPGGQLAIAFLAGSEVATRMIAPEELRAWRIEPTSPTAARVTLRTDDFTHARFEFDCARADAAALNEALARATNQAADAA